MQKQLSVSAHAVRTDHVSVRTAPALNAHDILQGRREITIRHDGQEYRLRVTRQNKLILTK